jgi:hypothetical protein
MPNNPNSPLICGIGKSLGRHLRTVGIGKIYCKYKNEVFPKLLESPNVLPEDKQKISELLKKPWNPYIRRHSALTEKSKILREHILRQRAGWSARSNVHINNLHYYGNESSQNLLEEYGLIDKGIQINPLQPKICTNCSETNKPDSKFCVKCRMVLTYDAYSETKMQMDKIDTVMDEIDQLKERLGISQ